MAAFIQITLSENTENSSKMLVFQHVASWFLLLAFGAEEEIKLILSA